MKLFLFIGFLYICNVLNCMNINVESSHPRLLLKSGEEQDIKGLIYRDSNMLSVHEYIMKKSEEFLSKKPLERIKTGKRLLAVSRDALQRIYYLSYAYRMTGNKKYAKRAEKELLAVCGFSDWNPSHYLDVGEMTMAVAIGYDWLYDCLSESVRKVIRKAIIEKAFDTAEIGGFYDRTNNWNQVCNSGLVFGALAIYEDEPDISKKIITKAVETLPLAMKSYLPDGNYPEGFSYWGYGTGFEVTMLAAMETAMNTDMGLSDNNGFMHSPYFMLFMTAPSGWCYNFCDSGKNIGINMAMYWFAAKKNDMSLLWYEYPYLRNMKKYSNDMDRLLPNILIFSKELDFNNIKAPKGNYWYGRGDKPVFVYRSGWNSKNDTFLGVVGGSASIPHGHMDAGSFIYEKNGVRWAIDLGLQSYYTLEKEGVDLWNKDQNGQRWDVFRLGNTAHSTITINNEKHLVDGNPEIIETYQEKHCKGAKLDLTSLYGDNIKSVVRKVALDVKDNLVISDNVETNEKSAEIMWTMVVAAEAEIISQNEIKLSKEGKCMYFKVDCPVSKELKIWQNKPVHSYDQDNPGTLRVGFVTKIKPYSKVNIKVKLEEK